MTTPHPPAPDFHAMAARRVHGLPDGWLPRIYRALGDARAPIGFRITGGVPLGVVTRGPRKGQPKFAPLRQLQTVTITYGDVKAAREEWVAATGKAQPLANDTTPPQEN